MRRAADDRPRRPLTANRSAPSGICPSAPSGLSASSSSGVLARAASAAGAAPSPPPRLRPPSATEAPATPRTLPRATSLPDLQRPHSRVHRPPAAYKPSVLGPAALSKRQLAKVRLDAVLQGVVDEAARAIPAHLLPVPRDPRKGADGRSAGLVRAYSSMGLAIPASIE